MNEHTYITVAYAVLIFIFSFCGILRFCNLFPHAIRNMEELYPARKFVVGVYFSVVLLLPCMLHPYSPDARLLARCFWIVYIPASASLAFRRFFLPDNPLSRTENLLAGAVPAMTMLVLSAFALSGGDTLQQHSDVITGSVEVMAVLLTVYLARVTLQVWHIIHGRSEKIGCKTAHPVPRRFASGIFMLPLAAQFAAWGVHLSSSALASAAFATFTAVIGAMILVAILRPQRIVNSGTALTEYHGDETEENTDDSAASDNDEENPDEEKTTKLPAQTIDKIEQQVRDAVERDRMYLNPDLTKADLVSLLGINDLYLHIVLKDRFGPFNKYINTLRMEHAIRYESERPDVKREELALKSGFGSVRTYYRAKAQYEKTAQKPQHKTRS